MHKVKSHKKKYFCAYNSEKNGTFVIVIVINIKRHTLLTVRRKRTVDINFFVKVNEKKKNIHKAGAV